MVVSQGKTVRVERVRRQLRPRFPAALLQIHPLGEPPQMAAWPLKAPEVALGRAPECAIQIDDELASRVHAVVRAVGDRWEIVDRQSANGLFVGGREVQTAFLGDGDCIRIGSTLLLFAREGRTGEPERHAVCDAGMVSGPSLDATRALLAKGAGSSLSVLITGETGTGKELAARLLHDKGPRAAEPFVGVNCAAIPREMVESELFGHVKGAFTGAVADYPGLMRQAHGGTLFLDEIGELAPESQSKLLRVLQDRCVRPIGGHAARPLDLRIVCATNRDLAADVQRGAFRPDLLARIAEMVIALPPLRQRVEDIPLLAEHFARKHSAARVELAAEALEALCLRAWPYNIRELESAVRRALLLADGAARLTVEHFARAETIGPAVAPAAATAEPPALKAPDELAALEALSAALREHEGSVADAARALCISRSQLYRRAAKLDLRPADFKPRRRRR